MLLRVSEPPPALQAWRIAPAHCPGSRTRHRRPFTAQHDSRAQAQASRRKPDAPVYIGLDFGTSGARAIAIDGDANIIAEAREKYGADAEQDWAKNWERSLWAVMDALPAEVKAAADHLVVDGMSATALLVDGRSGAQLAAPMLYNESQPAEVVAAVKAFAPEHHTATAPTSTLCKLAFWDATGVLKQARQDGAEPRLMHHADWLAGMLHGRGGLTDWNNALKLGFDPGHEAYPEWLMSQPYSSTFPETVLQPGRDIGGVTQKAAERTGLNPACIMRAGTTDSIAAFLAADVHEYGDAVTSLGSAIAVKLLSKTRVDDADYGIYSHRIGDLWLASGASNAGCNILRKYFSNDELKALSERIDVARSPGLDYYPLPKPGERCPVSDPDLLPRLSPRPEDDAVFLHGILEGLTDIESRIYGLLADLGSTPLIRVVTAGGGGVNEKWTQMRAEKLGVPVHRARQSEAAYGSALLARSGVNLAAVSA